MFTEFSVGFKTSLGLNFSLSYWIHHIFRESNFLANQDFKTFSRVVKFAIEEESNGRRIHLFTRALCTVQSVLVTSIAYTSRIPGVAFMRRDRR